MLGSRYYQWEVLSVGGRFMGEEGHYGREWGQGEC